MSLLVLLSMGSRAADWPQYRGAGRDGKTTESIATTWATTQPTEAWRANVGKGHAPVSIADGKAVTLGRTAEGDTVWCLDAATGKQIWRFDYSAAARMKDEPGDGGYDGPHAAPAIHNGNVYSLSRDGQVHCLNFDTGKPRWSRNLHADLDANFPECGFAGSPLLLDNMVIVSVGRAGTALDANTGQTKWHSGHETAGYGAPTLAGDAKGRRHLLFFAFKELVSVDPADGKQLWSLPWPTKWGANIADPVAVGEAVFISSAYDQGCALVDMATGKPRWRSQLLAAHASPMLLHEGCIYGFDGYINGPVSDQALICLDPLVRKVHWGKKGLGGQLILAGDKLVMLLVTGELVIAKASPKKYEELARGRVQRPEECPVPPTLVNGRLYCRTGQGILRCLLVAP